MTKNRYLLLATIVVAAACVRTLPYVLDALERTDIKQFTGYFWNFSPVTALFLFAGMKFPERRWAYGAPLAAMLLSDVAIGLLLKDMSKGLHSMIPAIYGSYMLVIWSGSLLRKLEQSLEEQNRKSHSGLFSSRVLCELLFLTSAAGAGLVAETAFFVITNFATWVGQTEYYPHTLEGLVQCYVAGIPFFKNALVSTPLYGVVIFGGSALATAWFPALQQRPSEIDNTEQALLV